MSTLNITALAGRNGSSIFQCWALEPGFATSSQAGTVGAKSLLLGAPGNVTITYAELPPHFAAGLHNAPYVQWVSFLSGLAYISLPNSTESVYVKGDANGLIIATDVASVSKLGHNTTYPSGETTIALEIPISSGIAPNHTVLHDGPCRQHLGELD